MGSFPSHRADDCSRLVVSPTNLILNSCLLLVLVAIQVPQCVQIIKTHSTNGIPSDHFLLDAFYQTMFMACVLYISSLPEGPIECCQPHGVYGPDPGDDYDWHLRGIQAYGVLIGVLQVAVVFLGSMFRLVLLFVYTPIFPPLVGSPIWRVAVIYGRILTTMLSLVPVCIFIDALASALAPGDSGGFLSESGGHKLVMTAYISIFYLFSGWLQHLPRVAEIWKNLEPESAGIRAKALVLQLVPMILLGLSLGWRQLQWAQDHLDELHDNRNWFALLYFAVGACEAWIIAAGQGVMLAMLLRLRLKATTVHIEDGREDEDADERTGLLTPTSSVGSI